MNRICEDCGKRFDGPELYCLCSEWCTTENGKWVLDEEFQELTGGKFLNPETGHRYLYHNEVRGSEVAIPKGTHWVYKGYRRNPLNGA